MIEKRASSRIDVNLRAVFREGKNEAFRTQITNISSGGLFMKTPQYLKIGTDVTVDIDAENIGQIIWVSGHVVRIAKTGVAVEITDTNKTNFEMFLETEKRMAARFKYSKNINSKNRFRLT
ncbi:MAG TPA: PilZ domain-containing protein [Desulfomonilia bacterium]|jgi:Tfp pilus assembly protein PilZ